MHLAEVLLAVLILGFLAGAVVTGLALRRHQG
jgi:type II secretory pathway pseudopilin PulG